MELRRKSFFADKQVTLLSRSIGAQSNTGMKTFLWAEHDLYVQEFSITETAQEMFVSRFKTAIKEIKRLVCRSDVVINLVDKIRDGNCEYEIIDVISQYRSGTQQLIIRRIV